MRSLALAGMFFAVSLGLLVLWMATALQENCGAGNDARVLCSEFLQETVLPTLPYAFLGAAMMTVLFLIIGLADLVHRRGSPPEAKEGCPHYRCLKCGATSATEEAAMEHAWQRHGAGSFPEMKATWEHSWQNCS